MPDEEREQPPEPLPPPPPAAPGRRFGIGAALACFAASLGGQFVGAILGVLLTGIAFGLMGREWSADRMDDALPTALLFAMSLSAAAVLGTTRLLLGGPIRERGREAFALLPSSGAAVALGAVAGVSLYALIGLLAGLWPPEHVSELARAASQSNVGYFAVVFLAVVIAPPLEEFLFRGVMYHGFRSRLPAVSAAAIVTILFVGMHAGQLVLWWPGWLVIGLLGVFTMSLRMWTRSLWPPLATHVVYNLLVTTAL